MFAQEENEEDNIITEKERQEKNKMMV